MGKAGDITDIPNSVSLTFSLVGEVARLSQKVGPEVGKAGDITDIPNSLSLHSALLVRWPD